MFGKLFNTAGLGDGTGNDIFSNKLSPEQLSYLFNLVPQRNISVVQEILEKENSLA